MPSERWVYIVIYGLAVAALILLLRGYPSTAITCLILAGVIDECMPSRPND